METDKIIRVLGRYSEKCLALRLDGDFAKAVEEAKKKLKDYKDCRNELCMACGEYHYRHVGRCDGCRWLEY